MTQTQMDELSFEHAALARLRRFERAADAEQKRLKEAIAKANAVCAREADFP